MCNLMPLKSFREVMFLLIVRKIRPTRHLPVSGSTQDKSCYAIWSWNLFIQDASDAKYLGKLK